MPEKFEAWAIVEVMGHQRLAGKVSEQVIGGTAFVRVDVPEVRGSQPFTKLLGNGAIYAITIVDEETARASAGQLCQAPMDAWSARRMLGLPEPKKTFFDLGMEEEEQEYPYPATDGHMK